jgi:hypothetical protein
VSHPIPLHTAGKLERALEASSRFVAARGAKGWVMRIVAYFACQYCEAVIELLEGLLAEYRAGTLVFPDRADESPVVADECETAKHPLAASRSRSPAVRRAPAPRAGAPHESAAKTPVPAQFHPVFAVAPPRPPVRRPEPKPRGLAAYPSAVPRWPNEKFGNLDMPLTHVQFVTVPKHYAESLIVLRTP